MNSFHINNSEQARLSLIDNGEDPDANENLLFAKSNIYNEKSFIFGGQLPPVQPPPARPPLETFSPLRIIWDILVAIFFTALFIVGIPVFLALFIVFGVVPWLSVQVLLKCVHGRRLSLLPVSKVFGSTDWNHHTVAVVCRGRCEIEKIRTHIAAAVNASHGNFSVLKKRLDKRFGFLCLEDLSFKFDIKNHVKHFNIRTKGITVDIDDVIPYLESTYDQPFENHLTVPQWEVLVIPKYTHRVADSKLLADYERCRRSYCLVFRFQNGIMNWNLFQMLLVEALGKTNGRIKSIFSPEVTLKGISHWQKFKNFLAAVCLGPQKFLRNICTSKQQFTVMKGNQPNRTHLGMAKTIGTDVVEDIKDRTWTGVDCILGNCVRIALRNMSMGLGTDFPKNAKVVRIFNSVTQHLQGVDMFHATYNRYRNIIQRLHVSFHAIEKKQASLAGQRSFNKMIMIISGFFPAKIAAWFYKIILRGNIIMELWPGADQDCKIFDGDVVADIFGWAGSKGIESSFKVTITTYCERIRVNFFGKLGYLVPEQTDAHILTREFEEEFSWEVETCGIHPNRCFVPPLVRDCH